QELIADPDIGRIPPASNYIPPNTKVVQCEIWRQHFYNTHPADSQTTKQKAFVRAAATLQKARLIGIWSDKAWLAGHPGHARTSEDMSGERIEPDEAAAGACGKPDRPDRPDTHTKCVSSVRQPCPDRLSGSESIQEGEATGISVPFMITKAMK